MISISRPMKGAARYHTYLAQDDYYANRNEKAGHWWGTGASALGLEGDVDADEFRNLLEGMSPDGSRKLVQNAQTANRQCGWDAVFSPPKSVSVLWAMSSPEKRQEIEAAHLAAVQDALTFLSDEGGITRRGSGGATHEKAGLVVAIFEHAASRALDPDLHSHAFVINLGLRDDGSWGTLRSKNLFESRFRAEQIYHESLADRLRVDLKLNIVEEPRAFRVDGVPTDLCRTFSKRREAIKQFMAERGMEGTANAKLAALLTRPKKKKVSREQLFSYWHRVGEAHYWGPEQAKRLWKSLEKPTDGDDQSLALIPRDETKKEKESQGANASADRRGDEEFQELKKDSQKKHQTDDSHSSEPEHEEHLGTSQEKPTDDENRSLAQKDEAEKESPGEDKKRHEPSEEPETDSQKKHRADESHGPEHEHSERFGKSREQSTNGDNQGSGRKDETENEKKGSDSSEKKKAKRETQELKHDSRKKHRTDDTHGPDPKHAKFFGKSQEESTGGDNRSSGQRSKENTKKEKKRPGASENKNTDEKSQDPKKDSKKKSQGKKSPSQNAQQKSNKRLLRNRRWGKIRWRKKTALGEIRVQERRVFRHAPDWNPASKLTIAAIRVIPKKIELFKKPPPWERPESVYWKKSFVLAELQLVENRPFWDAPWSVARKINIPHLRFAWKSPESATESTSKDSDQSQSHSH